MTTRALFCSPKTIALRSTGSTAAFGPPTNRSCGTARCDHSSRRRRQQINLRIEAGRCHRRGPRHWLGALCLAKDAAQAPGGNCIWFYGTSCLRALACSAEGPIFHLWAPFRKPSVQDRSGHYLSGQSPETSSGLVRVCQCAVLGDRGQPGCGEAQAINVCQNA